MKEQKDSQLLREEILDKVREYYRVEFGNTSRGGGRIPFAGRVFD